MTLKIPLCNVFYLDGGHNNYKIDCYIKNDERVKSLRIVKDLKINIHTTSYQMQSYRKKKDKETFVTLLKKHEIKYEDVYHSKGTNQPKDIYSHF